MPLLYAYNLAPADLTDDNWAARDARQRRDSGWVTAGRRHWRALAGPICRRASPPRR